MQSKTALLLRAKCTHLEPKLLARSHVPGSGCKGHQLSMLWLKSSPKLQAKKSHLAAQAMSRKHSSSKRMVRKSSILLSFSCQHFELLSRIFQPTSWQYFCQRIGRNLCTSHMFNLKPFTFGLISNVGASHSKVAGACGHRGT